MSQGAATSLNRLAGRASTAAPVDDRAFSPRPWPTHTSKRQTRLGLSWAKARRCLALRSVRSARCSGCSTRRDREAPSPMAFALSVHNAASGVVSIATKNRGFTTSLGADHDTPAMALMEAIGLIAERGEPVVVVCGEEPTPTALVPDDEAWELATMAIALAPRQADGGAQLRLRGPFKASPTLNGPELRPTLARNPQVGLLDLIWAIEARKSGTIALDRGRGAGWCMEVLVADG